MSFCTRIMALFDLQIRTFSNHFCSSVFLTSKHPPLPEKTSSSPSTFCCTGWCKGSRNICAISDIITKKRYLLDTKASRILKWAISGDQFEPRIFLLFIVLQNYDAVILNHLLPFFAISIFYLQILFIVKFHFTTSNKNMKSRISKTKKQFLKPKKKNRNHRRFFGKI